MDNPLQAFLDALIRRWRLVGALTLLAMVAAALVSLSIKPTYEATAVIALAPSTLSVPTSNQSPPYYLTVDAFARLPKAFTPAYYIALLKSVPVAQAAQAAVSISSNASDRSRSRSRARTLNSPRKRQTLLRNQAPSESKMSWFPTTARSPRHNRAWISPSEPSSNSPRRMGWENLTSVDCGQFPRSPPTRNWSWSVF